MVDIILHKLYVAVITKMLKRLFVLTEKYIKIAKSQWKEYSKTEDMYFYLWYVLNDLLY